MRINGRSHRLRAEADFGDHLGRERLESDHWEFLFGDGKLKSFSAFAPMSDEIEVIDNGDGSYTERTKEK